MRRGVRRARGRGVRRARGRRVRRACGRGRLKVSVIQRPQAVESPGQGHTPNSGRGRVALSTVILAKRGSPGQGRSSTLSLPFSNHPGDSRAERENDSNV